MSEPTTEKHPGVAAAVMPRREGVGILPPEFQQAIELRKQLNLAAAQMANLSWGKTLDEQTRRAIADFCRTYKIDPATEIHLLGGNVYVNAAFYLRKLGHLVQAGVISYAFPDFIHKDQRLEDLANAGHAEAEKERARRQWARIEFDVDDSAVSACVFRIKSTKLDREVTGCKAIYSDSKDPVGNASPMETVETRAVRRAMRKLVSHVDAGLEQLVEIEVAAERISERVESFRERQKAIGTVDQEPTFQLGKGVTLKPGGGGTPLAHDDLPLAPGERREIGADGIEVTTVETPQRQPEPAQGDAFEEQTDEDRALDLKAARE